MVYPATLSTFDSPKVAKPRLLSPARQGFSFFGLSEEFCGQPQAQRILALKCAKDGKPKAMRLISRILLFIPSTKPLVMR